MYTHIFERVLRTVVAETEISAQIIMSRCNEQEVVDARYLLVYFLRREGFAPCGIAVRLRMTPQGVSQILRKFDDRKAQGGRIFEITYKRIGNELETS